MFSGDENGELTMEIDSASTNTPPSSSSVQVFTSSSNKTIKFLYIQFPKHKRCNRNTDDSQLILCEVRVYGGKQYYLLSLYLNQVSNCTMLS